MKMTNVELVGSIVGGVVAFLGALKLPELYKSRTDRDKEIHRLETRISNMAMGFNQLSIMIKNILPEDAMLQESLEEIRRLFNSEEDEQRKR